jgi:prephenate dehydrogenase
MAVQISFIGLGQIGTSIGLALAGQKETIHRHGNDRQPGVARQAEKMGAIDKINYNLPSLVRSADLVILDIPVDEIQETLKIIALDLKEGAVVLDTSTVKNPVSAWAAELLPPNRHLVAWTPSFNPAYLQETASGIDAAHADLFQNSLIFITHAQGTAEQAVKLAADLATLVGSRPFFADPYETEGLLAASHMLPWLTAAAVLNSTQDQPGWDEGRKLAGKRYAEMTTAITELDGTTNLGQAALLNRQNVVRVLDSLMNALFELREAVDKQDAKKLTFLLDKAVKGRNEWLAQRHAANWGAEKEKAHYLPTSGEKLGQLIGLGRRKTPKNNS